MGILVDRDVTQIFLRIGSPRIRRKKPVKAGQPIIRAYDPRAIARSGSGHPLGWDEQADRHHQQFYVHGEYFSYRAISLPCTSAKPGDPPMLPSNLLRSPETPVARGKSEVAF